MRKPPKKKKKKRKRPKSPQAGQYTTLALPEDQRNQRMFVNPDDPYYRGADLANGYSPGGVTLEGNQGTGRGKFQEGYWRDGTPGGGGGQGTPGGADASPGRVSGVMGVAGAGAGVAGAAGYQGDGDGRSQGGDRSPGGGAGYMGAGAGGVGGAAGAGDDSATDAERLDRIDYRGGGGAKRFYGDIEDDKATPWTTGNGITKRPKKAKKEDDGTPDTPMRSQKELYVDYDKLAEFEQ